MVYTFAEHPPIGFLVQLRSVKCAGSSLLPEPTGQAGRGLAGSLPHARITASAVLRSLVLSGRSVCTIESAGHRPAAVAAGSACAGVPKIDDRVQPLAGRGERLLHLVRRADRGEDEPQVLVPVGKWAHLAPQGDVMLTPVIPGTTWASVCPWTERSTPARGTGSMNTPLGRPDCGAPTGIGSPRALARMSSSRLLPPGTEARGSTGCRWSGPPVPAWRARHR